jgi:hypothetical protein
MGFYVCLFLARAEEAAAIRSVVTTGARPREAWPHLVVPKVDGPDMNKLERLARPKRAKGSSRLGGVLLDRSKLTDTPFTAVSQMTPEFVNALAALDAAAAQELARAWAGAIDGVTEEEAARLVREMADFACRAIDTGLPMLELVCM